MLMRRGIVTVILCCVSVMWSGTAAQNVEDMEKIMLFYGADAPEDLDSEDVERMGKLLSRPLRLNCVSRTALRSSGLFSPYQVASLSDYRARHGDVLSFEELSCVEGFGRYFVRKVAPFVSLESMTLPGSKAGTPTEVEGSLTSRVALREDGRMSYGVKSDVDAGMCAGVALSRQLQPYGLKPGSVSGYLEGEVLRGTSRIIAGDFNARFGQGLVLWNGLGVGGLSAPSSFMKRPSGLSHSSSFTGNYALRGVAVEHMSGPARVSAFVAAEVNDDVWTAVPAANVSILRPWGALGITHYADLSLIPGSVYIPDMKTSFDSAICVRGVDIFLEAAYDWGNRVPAALSGIIFPVGEWLRMASMLRLYPSSYSPSRSAAARSTTKCSNEYGASLAGEFAMGDNVRLRGMTGFGSVVRRHRGTFSADVAFFPQAKKGDDTFSSLQVKILAEWQMMLTDALSLKIRFGERFRSWGNPMRTELRIHFSYRSSRWISEARLNMVSSTDTALLAYIEGGHVGDRLASYLRFGIFCVDDWEDRIYVYERDAPGYFSVPAYYGRGLWGALTASWRINRSLRTYARAAFTSYPFMKGRKSGRAELKLQIVYDF